MAASSFLGSSFSAADAAGVARQVYLSPGRSGLRLMNRLRWDGTSHELRGMSRLISFLVSTKTAGKVSCEIESLS